MEKLSIVIITKNEESNIGRCLKSVRWADEIVVIDSGSTDRTLEICRDYSCVITSSEWLGFGRTKQLAAATASNHWLFSIDADEEMTTELANKIREILSGNVQKNGYRIRRMSFYLGKLIRHSGWNRDYPLRLFNRKHGTFNEKDVHESVEIDGDIGNLNEPLLHYTYPTISSHLIKMDRYTSIGADVLYQKGKKVTIAGAIIRGIVKFIKMYIIQGGIMDGREGFVLALNSAYGVYLKYLKLWKLNH
ncbi:MAG: glycosyltransferase family 2 protein [Calditrichaceae bacterium]